MIEEALIGVAFSALYDVIKAAINDTLFFKKTLESLESTLRSLQPLIQRILNSENPPSTVCNKIAGQLEKAKELIAAYSDIKFRFFKKWKVAKLIEQLNSSLERTLTLELQVEQMLYHIGPIKVNRRVKTAQLQSPTPLQLCQSSFLTDGNSNISQLDY